MTLREILNEASAELTSAGTGKEIKYFIKHVSAPNLSAYQIVMTTDGYFDLYAKDDCGLDEIYKDKSTYIGSIKLVHDDSDAKDNQERTIYELFKKYIDKLPPKIRKFVREEVNGRFSWYKRRKYFEEI